MKKKIRSATATTSALILFASLITVFLISNEAWACGWRNSGGEAFGPRQNNTSSYKNSAGISKEQAVLIITQHVKKLNPELKVGQVNDTGPLYEAEILSTDEEVLQVIGVYKQSGQVVVVN